MSRDFKNTTIFTSFHFSTVQKSSSSPDEASLSAVDLRVLWVSPEPACCCVSQLNPEQASFTLPRSAEIDGKCGSTESEIHISWKNKAYTLRIYFSKVGGGGHGLRQLDNFFAPFFVMVVVVLGGAGVN